MAKKIYYYVNSDIKTNKSNWYFLKYDKLTFIPLGCPIFSSGWVYNTINKSLGQVWHVAKHLKGNNSKKTESFINEIIHESLSVLFNYWIKRVNICLPFFNPWFDTWNIILFKQES